VGAFNLPDAVVGVARIPWTGISILLEDSYISRFFVKFIEILAAGFATACSAYVISQLVGAPPAATPTAVAVTAPAAVEARRSEPAQPALPAVAVDEQRSAPRPMTDAPAAQSAPKAARVATAVAPAPASKDIKTGTSLARGEKSAEALARAALANLDADRPAPAEAPTRRATAVTPAAAPSVELVPRPIDLPPPRPADMPPPPAAAEAPPRHASDVDALPPNAGAPHEIAAPASERPAEESRGLFSVPKRILGLLRPGTPSLAGEAPRPPMPVGSAARE
jgi:hypothetical protein